LVEKFQILPVGAAFVKKARDGVLLAGGHHSDDDKDLLSLEVATTNEDVA
jgi:hypothetical protein